MKKIYFSILTLIGSLTVVAQTVPTCSLDASFIASPKIGVWPDSATNFIAGVVGQPYVQNLTIKVPKDTVSSGVTFCFNRFELTTPTANNYNLPPGLQIGSSTSALANGTVNAAPSLKFPGNANNCASIFGTPTTAGTYTLNLKVQPYVTPSAGSCSSSPNVSGGSALTAAQTLNYYIIKITAPVGVKEIGKDKFGVMQNQPNPFSGLTKIKYYVEDQDAATLTVYNTLGAIVHQETVKTAVGENTFEVNAANWTSGMYIYTVKYKNTLDTKRLMVSNNN